MTQDQRKLRDWIEAQEWTFAKTVPDAPHEYVVCMDPERRRFLNWFVRYAAKHGYTGYFMGRRYRYVRVGELRYWQNGGRFMNRTRWADDPPEWWESRAAR